MFLTKLITRLDELTKSSSNPEFAKALKNQLQQKMPDINDRSNIQLKMLKAEIQQILQGINSKETAVSDRGTSKLPTQSKERKLVQTKI